MGITNKYKRVPLTAIRVTRDARLRQNLEIEADGLTESVSRLGVLHPIIVKPCADDPEAFELIAGERRLTASAAAGLHDIPIRLTADLSALEHLEIELEENIRRRDMGWQDRVRSVQKMHSTLIALNGDAWTQTATAERLGYDHSSIAKMLQVAQELSTPVIADAPNFVNAWNILARRNDRAEADALSDLLEIPKAPAKPAAPGQAPSPEAPAAQESVLCEDFVAWAGAYAGPKFNFLHCDFPYGIEVFSGPQMGAARHEAVYNDSEETYWRLCRALCANLDRIMAPSGHLLFWLSADIKIMYRTLEFFNAHAPSLDFQPKPLIWHKTDNVGVLADPQRGTRHVYEACLMASREDRKIIRAVSDTYGAPKGTGEHPSAKPVPVLKHFFQMFIDEHTRMLDPTCGSGTSLRAAEALGAAQVLGLELDPGFAAGAQSALRKDRALRAAAR